MRIDLLSLDVVQALCSMAAPTMLSVQLLLLLSLRVACGLFCGPAHLLLLLLAAAFCRRKRPRQRIRLAPAGLIDFAWPRRRARVGASTRLIQCARLLPMRTQMSTRLCSATGCARVLLHTLFGFTWPGEATNRSRERGREKSVARDARSRSA